jgi:serine/threonine protein kinase
MSRYEIKDGLSSYGTTCYLCPEGYKKIYSVKSDIWSIGICLYLLLTNEYPFAGSEEDDEEEYSRNVYKGNIYFSKKLSENMLTVLKTCLDYNIKKRPTVDELIAIL